ncbi:hypothetical protein E4U42_000123 [Claviceps africana]|uniref:alpha-1,2-Mannosidase n=1 Tax=Claviceps africana TaxID=83212 RepID=A0A8K0JBR4_9HYPO|nr:hypothetical protein E4U42_000123 [Claviceps africana]
MITRFQGPVPRRYVACSLFLVVVIFLWRGYAPVHRLPHSLPSSWSSSTSAAFTSSSAHHNITYVPSTIDWSKARVFHPPKRTVPLPSGLPKTLPRVQHQQEASNKAEDGVAGARKEAVRTAFLKSWNAYKRYAWGRDELRPLSGKGKTTFSGWSAQLVDALDSLWIMGFKDDFYQAVEQVARINWSQHDGETIDVFEVTIRYLGGLLSAYDLSQEKVLLDKAVELGDALYMAFDTPNRLPTHWLSYAKARTGETTGDSSISGAVSGSLCVEFTRLSQITGDAKYYDATERVKRFFYEHQNHTKAPGLWPWDLNFRRGTIEDGFFTFGAGADSLYEYLPKMYALLGGLDPQYADMTTAALDAGRDVLLFKPMTPGDEDILMSGNMDVAAEQRDAEASMQHLACFAGGMYALAGQLFGRKDYVHIAARLTAGCVWAYDSFETNVMPELSTLYKCEKMDAPCPYNEALFIGTGGSSSTGRLLPDGFLRVDDARYMLRPEAIESVFYMWRVSGDAVWRDAAWRMWEGIVKETETKLAFATIMDTTRHGSGKADTMETFWLAETTKYFYLTFEDEDVMSLDEWVFNTEAHPVKRPTANSWA